MSINKKQQFKELIQSNIDRFGYHITIVGGGLSPRYTYTIGLTELFKFELVFSGGVYYLKDQLGKIFNEVVKAIKQQDFNDKEAIEVDSLGSFMLSTIDPSWNSLMLLGVFDYYNTTAVRAFQIIPDSSHYTLDIPTMSKAWSADSEPVWQWLVRNWDRNVPESSTVATNINALLGEDITEVMRYEDDEWEMYAGPGPDVEKEDMRVVSLATILGIDKTLESTVNLEIGKGLWRESSDSKWNSWG